jgi:hypothetical protein
MPPAKPVTDARCRHGGERGQPEDQAGQGRLGEGFAYLCHAVFLVSSRWNRRRLFLLKWQSTPAAGEDAVMAREVADEVEIRCEAGFVEHAPGVAAHREDAAGLDGVVLVKDEALFLAGDASAIDDRLAVVLTLGLQAVQLE